MKLLQVVRKKHKRVPEHDELVVQFQEWLVSEERFKADPWRNQGARFYPSSFAFKCDRSMALKFCKAPESSCDRDPRLEITFKLGDGIHGELQKLFLKFAAQQEWEFKDEVRIKPDENPWFISGRVDGEIYFPITDVTDGIEIKSINSNDFNALHKRAKKEHQEQGNIYVHLRDLRRIHYLYVNKDKSTFKEFIHYPDKELFKESMLRIEQIMVTMQDDRFPVCANCTRRCEFYGINKNNPDLKVEDIADAHIIKAITQFKPTFLRTRRKTR